MKLGLIGLGHVSRYQLEAIAKVRGLELTEAFDLNRNTRGDSLHPEIVVYQSATLILIQLEVEDDAF